MRAQMLGLVAAILWVGVAAGDGYAIREDGSRVLLKDDGTWAVAALPEEGSGFDFRNTRWGMTHAEVLRTETARPAQDTPELLIYPDQVVGLKMYVAYVFVDDKLVTGKYRVDETHTNKNDFMDDFVTLKAALTEKYGSPTEDKVDWKNDLYKGDEQHFGKAIGSGHLVMYSKWETDRTSVAILISGENYSISVNVHYKSRALSGLEDRTKVQDTVDEL